MLTQTERGVWTGGLDEKKKFPQDSVPCQTVPESLYTLCFYAHLQLQLFTKCFSHECVRSEQSVDFSNGFKSSFL